MANYMFLLYNGPDDFEGVGPDEMQGVIERYQAWSDGLGQAGKLVGGEKLVDGEGRVLSPRSGKLTVTDGPFSETKEVIGGYFVVSAESYDEALEIAKGCPHADYGPIEIRAVDEMA